MSGHQVYGNWVEKQEDTSRLPGGSQGACGRWVDVAAWPSECCGGLLCGEADTHQGFMVPGQVTGCMHSSGWVPPRPHRGAELNRALSKSEDQPGSARWVAELGLEPWLAGFMAICCPSLPGDTIGHENSSSLNTPRLLPAWQAAGGLPGLNVLCGSPQALSRESSSLPK